MGIPFLGVFNGCGEVMVVSPGQGRIVAALPYVRWLDLMRPEYKIDKSSPSRDAPDNGYIQTGVGDCKECREDLARLGIKTGGFFYDTYGVVMSPDDISAIADLWWVLSVGFDPDRKDM